MTSRDVRLTRELKNLQKVKDPHMRIGPGPSGLDRWICEIKTPTDCVYAGGRFVFDITIPTNYPHTPPSVVARTKIFHPNIHFVSGEVCLDILKTEWTPAWNLEGLGRALLVLLQCPDASSPLNCDAANMIRAGDERAYASLCRFYTKRFAPS